MLTRLLPTRIADRASSNFSMIFTARAAALLPSSAAFSSRIRLAEENDISEAEKNAEQRMHSTTAAIST